MQKIISHLINAQFEDDDRGHGDQGIIHEGNYEDFLSDEAEDQIMPVPPPVGDLTYVRRIPYKPQEGRTSLNLVYDGIDNSEIIEFEYTTRHGVSAGWRRVEPHYTFVATTTGNEVLVTYDLTPGIDESKGRIRAFIVGNIHPGGIRYDGEGFEPRGEIMRGIY